jgi:group II intron reverse transcriptase/maturase
MAGIFDVQESEVCEMQSATTILSIIRERGKLGLPLKRVYRQLFNRELYLMADGRIYRNHGAMTPGATLETVDGMSLQKIDAIILALRQERYHWTPVRRIYIEKKRSNKLRPLGLPSWSDKLLQEVVRLILEAYYEPTFSKHAHGFRPHRGCHTALTEIRETWTGTAWLIEGDIQACFDSIDHSTLLTILAEQIHDNRFLRLLARLLRAGYLEDWNYRRTLSGTPQGSIVSPILSNVYLDKLDQFVEHTLLPQHNRKAKRRANPAYSRTLKRLRTLKKRGDRPGVKAGRKALQTLPSVDTDDPEYRWLHYVRYADDTLFGFCGPREEAEAIKQQLAEFLRSTLKLTLSPEKTLITHARTQAARFLGYEVMVIQKDILRDHTGRRAANGTIGLKVPLDVIKAKR